MMRQDHAALTHESPKRVSAVGVVGELVIKAAARG
jgi:hypothetical protein